jgi:hypothetical protein
MWMECGMRGGRAMLTLICIGAQSVSVKWLALQFRIRKLPGSNTSPKILFVRGFPQCLEIGHDHFLPHMSNWSVYSVKNCRPISRVNVELKINVSEISLFPSSGSRWWITLRRGYLYHFVESMPLLIGVLCSRRAESNCAVTHPNVTYRCVA